MWMTELRTGAAALVATMVVTGGGLLAQQGPAARAEVTAKPAASAEVAQAEAKVAEIRELVRPRPGEHVTNIARIAWEHDPWKAAVRAGREGKPILAWGEC